MKGRIHSYETMGLLDGPGIRTVVFLQGCSLRCLYCHNPDTWNCAGGREWEAEELFAVLTRFEPYYRKSGGGVTFSGGEPLLQPEFLLEMLKKCKEAGIHTAIDTAGAGKGNYDEILRNTDLVILDVKHWDPEGFRKMTGGDFTRYLGFREAVLRNNSRVILRHVVIPGHTDSPGHLERIAAEMGRFTNVEKKEFLPYHTMGKSKYEAMGMEYPLEGVPPCTREETDVLESRYLK